MASAQRKRASAEGVAERRQFKAAFSGLLIDIGNWQAEVARLVGAMARHDDTSLQRRRVELRQRIAEGQDRLKRSLDHLPGALRTHSRVTDLQRALDHLLSRLAD